MIGHMLLRKYYDGEDILGLKVIGGQPMPGSVGVGVGVGECGAFVEKVKRDSVADLEGHIRPGKVTSMFHLFFHHNRYHRHFILSLFSSNFISLNIFFEFFFSFLSYPH